MTFADWIVRQFTNFSVLTMVTIVLFNWFTTTRAINRQMKDQKLYHEFEEIKEEIGRLKNDIKHDK